MTTYEISDHIESLIPADLYAKYTHLSYAEMARVEELEDYAEELLQAEEDWYTAETGGETPCYTYTPMTAAQTITARNLVLSNQNELIDAIREHGGKIEKSDDDYTVYAFSDGSRLLRECDYNIVRVL